MSLRIALRLSSSRSLVGAAVAGAAVLACGGAAENQQGGVNSDGDDERLGSSTGGEIESGSASGGSASAVSDGPGGSVEIGAGGMMPGDTDCEVLNQARVEALEAARTCDMDGDIEAQCGSAAVDDECGCGIMVNALAIDLVQAAREARQSWSRVCLAPETCGECLPPPPSLPTCAGGSKCTF